MPAAVYRGRNQGEHAIVIGGSVGGLLAARVLADHYGEVRVVERDNPGDRATHRRGVPQDQHVHGLFTRGAAIFEDLFPGFGDEIIEWGGRKVVFARDGRWLPGGHPLASFQSRRATFAASRPLTESRLRERVRALSNVSIVGGCEAVRPVVSDDGASVRGLKVRHRDDEAREEELGADVVVDATGRGSRSPRWLEDMGYPAPEEERLEVNVRYMTRLYERYPEHADGDAFIVVTATPENPRFGVAMAVEGDKWMVTLCGYAGDQAPADEEGYRDFAASLAAPDIAELLGEARPCGEAVPASFPAHQRRRYDRLDRFPRGYLVFGDALCSFNPLYGQGMTMCAVEAQLLREQMASEGTLDARRFFRATSKPIEDAWSIATGGDLNLKEVEGPRPVMVRVLNAYLSKVMPAASRDKVVARTFADVVNMERRPTSLMRPGVVSRVAWRSVWG